ncbi:hypothetical protein JWG44_12310 [Leptospira sp. 201903071]|nr:hypothetical protein [Leptospira ainazelensis]
MVEFRNIQKNIYSVYQNSIKLYQKDQAARFCPSFGIEPGLSGSFTKKNLRIFAYTGFYLSN